MLKKLPFKELDVRKMIAEVETTSWLLRECIRVRELAATHRLEQMRRLRMLEEQKAWKRESGFDQIEIIAKMREQYFLAGFDLEPTYSKLLLLLLSFPHISPISRTRGHRRRLAFPYHRYIQKKQIKKEKERKK